jgi:hypothetical protein
MVKRFAVSLLLAVFALVTAARADMGPTMHGPPNAAEAAFVKSIQADLMKRFPTAADAEKAGYIRYTNEDETGAISYANRQWNSHDAKHPSQLWYDTSGKLLGADFSVPMTSKERPHLWGIDPGRWTMFGAHMHYVARDPKTGKMLYDQDTSIAKFKAAGGDPDHPQAQTLVKLGRVSSANDVTALFLFPSIWDLIVWVKPNPAGAFTDKNPLVHPSGTHSSM